MILPENDTQQEALPKREALFMEYRYTLQAFLRETIVFFRHATAQAAPRALGREITGFRFHNMRVWGRYREQPNTGIHVNRIP